VLLTFVDLEVNDSNITDYNLFCQYYRYIFWDYYEKPGKKRKKK